MVVRARGQARVQKCVRLALRLLLLLLLLLLAACCLLLAAAVLCCQSGGIHYPSLALACGCLCLRILTAC